MNKICKTCKTEVSINLFPTAGEYKGKLYKRAKCHKCYMGIKTLRKQKLNSWFLELKKTKNCEDCGIRDYRVLEFHHLDPTKKLMEVANMINSYAIESIEKEIEKCVCLCANCHRIRHNKTGV